QHLARILPVNAGDMAQNSGFSRAVGTDQTVNGSFGHLHGQTVQRTEAVKGLDHILYLYHCAASFPVFCRSRWHNSSVLIPRNSSSAAVRSKTVSREVRRFWSTSSR